MCYETYVFPPADCVTRGHLARRSAIADGDVRHGNIGGRGEFEERRVEREHLFALRARAFRKDDLTFAVVEPVDELVPGSRGIAAVRAVDEDNGHGAHDATRKDPVFDLLLCNEYAGHHRAQGGDIDVA